MNANDRINEGLARIRENRDRIDEQLIEAGLMPAPQESTGEILASLERTIDRREWNRRRITVFVDGQATAWRRQGRAAAPTPLATVLTFRPRAT